MSGSNTKRILIGPAGEEIRTLLSNSGNPVKAIENIQNTFGLNLPGIEDMYPLLDLCGYSRFDIHKVCLDALNTETVKYIESPSFQLENFHDLFSKTFPYIDKPYMQPIPMALLKKFERYVSDDIISQIKANITVFENCPMNIKQRIWKEDELFFQKTMMSVLNSYHYDDDLKNISLNLQPSSYQEIIEQRRSHPIIIKIIEYIGNDPVIYSMFTRMLKIVFKATPHPSLCSLRVDVLLNFHTMDAVEILRTDDCHHLIWSLDSCIRNQGMDNTIVEKIKECFDDVKNGTDLYTEYAMILMDPLISNFLALCIMRWIRNSVDNKAPSNVEDLINYSAKLLNLAEHAPVAVANDSKIQKLDKDLKSKFWDLLCRIMVEEDKETTMAMKESDNTLLLSMLKRSDIARKVFVQYLVDRTHASDLRTLNICLPLVIITWPTEAPEEPRIIYKETYQSFAVTMIDIISKRDLQKLLIDQKWRKIVVENFLLKMAVWDGRTHEKMIMLITEYYYSLDPRKVNEFGAQSKVLAGWTEFLLEHGYRDDMCLSQLKERYRTLITKSNSSTNGEYGINSHLAMAFIQ
ncbi:cofactor of BRCA1-domain-containing protein [Pilobolus umbonatus]|nr:cofactor of BRCA1-domain-containing protein [Pilobolus umbonatus]